MKLCRQFAATLKGFLKSTLEEVNVLAPPEGVKNERGRDHED